MNKSFRLIATRGQLDEFERRCRVTEGMFARTLCQRFEIEPSDKNLELVAGWLKSARSMGIVNHMDCGIRIEAAEAFNAEPKPRIVCLCGSTRYAEQFREANYHETLAGRIVLSIGCDLKADIDIDHAMGRLSGETKTQLDELHKRKIDLADEVLVINVDDYIGDSTRSEIEYARVKGKRVRWMCVTQHSQEGDVAG